METGHRPLTAISAVLSAVTDAWVIAVALGLWTVLELAMGLVPDLPDRLRNRQPAPLASRVPDQSGGAPVTT